MKAVLAAFLVASSAMGAQGEATGLEAYRFEHELACGKHLLPPSVCYPLAAFQVMDDEVKRLQAIEKEHKAESGRFTFLVVGFTLGIVTGALLGGLLGWLLKK